MRSSSPAPRRGVRAWTRPLPRSRSTSVTTRTWVPRPTTSVASWTSASRVTFRPLDRPHGHRDLHAVADWGRAEMVHRYVYAKRRLARVEVFADEAVARVFHVMDHRRRAVDAQFVAEEVDGVARVDVGVFDPANSCCKRCLHLILSVVSASMPMKSFTTRSARYAGRCPRSAELPSRPCPMSSIWRDSVRSRESVKFCG